MLKLYIAVLDEVPDHMTPVLVAHATLRAHLAWHQALVKVQMPHEAKYQEWLYDSFRKVVLKVNRKEFDKIQALPHTVSTHENSTLNGEQSCAVVCPQEEIPNVLKFAKMWKPNFVLDS